jgi:hypothetical protein
MKLVVDDQRLRSIPLLEGGIAERLPHVHDGDADFPAILRAKPPKEGIEALFRAILAAEPDGPTTDQIADNDAILMTSSHRDFVDADRGGALDADATELFGHVLFVQLLDGVPIEQQLLGQFADGCRSATSSNIVGEPLRVERMVCQPFQAFVLHGLAPRAIDTPSIVGQVDAPVSAREITHGPRAFVVMAKLDFATDAAHCFF